jgi:thioesterase domain-containing protein
MRSVPFARQASFSVDETAPSPRFTDAAYVPRPYSGRITLFKAAVGTYDDYRDRWNGWRGLASQGIEVHIVPGDHRFLLSEPHVEVLARQLAPCLEAAQRRPPARAGTTSLSLARDFAAGFTGLMGG